MKFTTDKKQRKAYMRTVGKKELFYCVIHHVAYGEGERLSMRDDGTAVCPDGCETSMYPVSLEWLTKNFNVNEI